MGAPMARIFQTTGNQGFALVIASILLASIALSIPVPNQGHQDTQQSAASRHLLGSHKAQSDESESPDEVVPQEEEVEAEDEKPAALLQDEETSAENSDEKSAASIRLDPAWTAEQIERMAEDDDPVHHRVNREAWPQALRDQTTCFRKWSCGCFDRDCSLGKTWTDWEDQCKKANQASDLCVADNSPGGCHELYHEYLPHERKEKSHHVKAFNLGVHDGVIEGEHHNDHEMSCGPLVLEGPGTKAPVYEDGVIVVAHDYVGNFTHRL